MIFAKMIDGVHSAPHLKNPSQSRRLGHVEWGPRFHRCPGSRLRQRAPNAELIVVDRGNLRSIPSILNIERAQKDLILAEMAEHGFQASVGAAVGFAGVIAGFWRVPQTLRLLFSSRTEWRK